MPLSLFNLTHKVSFAAGELDNPGLCRSFSQENKRRNSYEIPNVICACRIQSTCRFRHPWPMAACAPAPFEQATTTTVTEAPTAQALVQVSPEEAGKDSERLDRVTQAMQAFVDEVQLPGAVTIASRDNKQVHLESVGYRDIEA